MRVSFKRVQKALDNIENEKAYYAGGTLCIDFKDHPNVCLNLNGRGFSYFAGTNFADKMKDKKGQKFIVSRDMQIQIQEAYKKHKLVAGNRDYFLEHKLEGVGA